MTDGYCLECLDNPQIIYHTIGLVGNQFVFNRLWFNKRSLFMERIKNEDKKENEKSDFNNRWLKKIEYRIVFSCFLWVLIM